MGQVRDGGSCPGLPFQLECFSQPDPPATSPLAQPHLDLIKLIVDQSGPSQEWTLLNSVYA